MLRLRAYPVATVVIAQLFGTSLWFSPNSAANSLMAQWGLSSTQIGQLTSSTQVGFIIGTLLLASTGLADRYAASRICALSCLIGALVNAAFAFGATNFSQGLFLRFFVGLSLAGIYPLGMKLIISWSRGHTGTTLGWLVAMLTLGSALPHGVRAAGVDWSWHTVVATSSLLAISASLMIAALGDGPNLPSNRSQRVRWGAAFRVFLDARFRSSASGYFGHMWELYAFWTLLPFLLNDVVHAMLNAPDWQLSSWLSFAIMGVAGATGALIAGHLSGRYGSPKVAAVALSLSGLMCFLYPLIPDDAWLLKLLVLVCWGVTVVSDSAQFSATSAKVCPQDLVGAALAIQNSIGFAISVCSILLVMSLYQTVGATVTWLLVPGPLLGLVFFRRLLRAHQG